MNIITQIENALLAINQASFQTLINHLLHLEGNKFIASPGSVVGKEKTSKGTPDSFFVNGDSYIFVECTTKERIGKSKSFFYKLLDDIEHCFNDSESKISKEKIEKVFLACTEKISTEEYRSLKQKVKTHNPDTTLEVLTIQNLPMRIFDIPKLAEQYLNIQIVKGDIYMLEQFLLKTEKGLQPALTNEFVGRKEELIDCITILNKYDILLLSGGSGVGKSKLGVKILEELSKEKYIPLVIQSSGVSLWDDYQHLFLPNKKYIILFDDANKSLKNLVYLLSKLEDPKPFSFKIVITSRDYVKKQVLHILGDYSHRELSLKEFKDEDIGKIIVLALPNLKYYPEINRKIIELAKGNARVALMATNSIVPDAETNYLNSPVLLYEKYFKKISSEIQIFDNPIILKSLAIISFFGVLDRNNEDIKELLSSKFKIDWNELWSAIMVLHNSEISDVYAEEIVKVSDQVLATFAFYKCFIDKESAVLNYADWITTFIEKFPKRIMATLIDANNTFTYPHVKGLVLPHLKQVIQNNESIEELYSFYNLFWFYKGRECLLFLKKWIDDLSKEEISENLEFTYVHNEHISATKYFEILRKFWNHRNELLKPSLELTLKMLVKNPSRLPEVLKFINSDFSYKLDDSTHGYLRQNILFDVLLSENLTNEEKIFANGIFLNIANGLLGWDYSELGSAKGSAFSIYNFCLFKSDELMVLRSRILNKTLELFNTENKHCQQLLRKIVHAGGNFDKSIYVEELPFYEKLISEKLDPKQYTHCKFVFTLKKHLKEAGVNCVGSWNEFIESDIRKLSKFILPNWEYSDGQSVDECEKDKKEKFIKFVSENNWRDLAKFLFNLDELYIQQKGINEWYIDQPITDIYAAIARKSKIEFANALRLFFSGKVKFPLNASLLNVAMNGNVMTADELLSIINEFDFKGKPYWESTLVTNIPDEQISVSFLKLLLEVFQNKEEYLGIHRMLDYLKYETVFNDFKQKHLLLRNHNIITYLTSLIFDKPRRTRFDFGSHFFEECASYFTNHIPLLKDVFYCLYEIDPDFDHNGKELKAILDIDNKFLIDSLKNGKVGLGYYSKVRLEKINTSELWQYENYEELIEDLFITAIEQEAFTFFIEDDICSLFRCSNGNEVITEKMKSLILKLTRKYTDIEEISLILVEVVYNNYHFWFIDFFREFLLVNKDINVTKNIIFGRRESWSGSRVPMIHKQIEFYHDVIKMINTLPDFLDYSKHIDYFEQKIIWCKEDIAREQKIDFMEEFY